MVSLLDTGTCLFLQSKDVFICYIIALAGSVIVVLSMVWRYILLLVFTFVILLSQTERLFSSLKAFTLTLTIHVENFGYSSF